MLKQFEEFTEKKVTKRSVYQLVHNNTSISKNKLHHQLGGSLSNISRHLNELENERLIYHKKGSGRTPGSYTIRQEAGFAIGGYANGDVYGVGLCDVSGTVIEKEERFFSSATTPREVTKFFMECKEHFLATHPEARENYLGAAFGFVGPVRREGGILMNPELISNWDIVPIKDYIENYLEEQVILSPWAECALMGELFFGTLNPYSTSVLMWIDRGIGIALANEGQMNLDKPEQSSAIGHQVVNFRGPRCTCGKKGCLNAYCTIESMYGKIQPIFNGKAKSIEKYNKDPWQTSQKLEFIADTIDNHESNRQTKKLISDIEEAFNAAISNYLFLTRPDNLILTGRTANRFQKLLSSIIERTCEESDKHIRIQTKPIFIPLTAEKMIRGATAITLNRYLGFIR